MVTLSQQRKRSGQSRGRAFETELRTAPIESRCARCASIMLLLPAVVSALPDGSFDGLALRRSRRRSLQRESGAATSRRLRQRYGTVP